MDHEGKYLRGSKITIAFFSYRTCYAWLTEAEDRGAAIEPSVASGIRLGIGTFNLVRANSVQTDITPTLLSDHLSLLRMRMHEFLLVFTYIRTGQVT